MKIPNKLSNNRLGLGEVRGRDLSEHFGSYPSGQMFISSPRLHFWTGCLRKTSVGPLDSLSVPQTRARALTS